MSYVYKTAGWNKLRRDKLLISPDNIALGVNDYVSPKLFGFIHKACMCPMEVVAIEKSTVQGHWLGPNAEGVLTWWLRCPACGLGGKIQFDLKWQWPLGLLEGVPEGASLPKEIDEAQKKKRENLKANCPEAKAGKPITEKGYNAYLNSLGDK